jgi:hypothetical protein
MNAPADTSHVRPPRLPAFLAPLLATAALLFFLAPPAFADSVICGPGSGAGDCQGPTGVAVDRDAGLLYVADDGNREVDVFDADDGSFLASFPVGFPLSGIAVDNDSVSPSPAFGDVYAFAANGVRRFQPDGDPVLAFGGDVAAAGPGDSAADEQQQVTVKATGGTFRLKLEDPFVGGNTQETPPLPHNASAAEVKAALEALPTLGGLGGTVTVTGGPGDPIGSSPYLITFESNLGGDDIPALATVNELTGSPALISVSTPVPGGAYEVCVPEAGDTCKRGSPGTALGYFASQPKLDLGPGGVVYVADNIGGGDRRLQQFDHEGNELLECSPLQPAGEFGNNLQGFAVDSSGGFYLASSGGRPVRKYDSSCALITAPPFENFHNSFNVQALALDAADNLILGDIGPSIDGQATPQMFRYDAAGAMGLAFYGNGTLQGRPVSFVPFSSPSGDLFAAEPTSNGLGRVMHLDYPQPGPVVHPNPALTTTAEEPVPNIRATLTAQINPEGEASTYRFQYVDDVTYQESQWAEAEETPSAELAAPASPAFAPPLFRLAQASAAIGCADPETEPEECLIPETTYHFRALAINADSSPAERIGPEAVFETGPSFELIDLWASEVTTDAATIQARVNPLGVSTTGRFEYLTQADYVAQDESFEGPATEIAAEVDFGASEEPEARAAELDSLQPGTAYRYRIVVESGLFGKVEELQGAFRTFALPGEIAPCANDAFRSGSAARLPDCRAYEMVSPIDKEGGDAYPLGPGLHQSAATVPAEGRGLTYSANRAFGDPDSSPILSQYLASRHPEQGWSSEAISPPREGPAFDILATGKQYKAFTEDLSTGWLRTESEPPLTEDAIPGFQNLYRRESPTGAYEALCPTEPPSLDGSAYNIELAALSGDGQTTAINGYDNLTPAATGEERAAYACRAGQLELVSVLPGGGATPGVAKIGTYSQGSQTRDDSTHNVVSDDGERIYWTDSGTRVDGPGRIYLRERSFAAGAECSSPATPCTVEVSEAVGGPGADAEATYWTASPDGERAIFSFASGALAGNLYAFDAVAGTTEPIAGGVVGLAGWSEDATRLYLVSDADLDAGGPGEAGTETLYLHDSEAGSFELVAVLPGGASGFSDCIIATRLAESRCARTTEDGLQLAFVSQDPLTGYDNTDATSPAPCGAPGGACDAEVYLFDATATGEKLRCVSCNPSSARPRGRNVGDSIHPAWIGARLGRREGSFRAPRELSADGRRLFFESFDALVSEDTNGAQDVYQWQAPGKGTCTAERPEFVESASGCVELISSGLGSEDVSFLDASADGSDVFIRTADSLLAQDPGQIDIYDARSGGGFPPPAPAPVPCVGEECRGASPAGPAEQGAGSAVFDGPPDVDRGFPPNCRSAQKKAQRKLAAARRAAHKGQAERARKLRKQASNLNSAAKRCRARAGADRRADR